MFYRPRIIPCLTLINRGLVKTVRFKKPRYIGDPINSVKIFNGKGVDELCLLDIRASVEGREPDFAYLKAVASEAFMPLSYGGGIKSLAHLEKLFKIGYEKAVINSALIDNPGFFEQAVDYAGSQSMVASIDVKNERFGRKACYSRSGNKLTRETPLELAKRAEQAGAGEILLNSITSDGTMQGYDLDLINEVSSAVSVPVIACGGAKDIFDLKLALQRGGAHAAAAGSMFVYYGTHKAVLVTFPEEQELIDEGIYSESWNQQAHGEL